LSSGGVALQGSDLVSTSRFLSLHSYHSLDIYNVYPAVFNGVDTSFFTILHPLIQWFSYWVPRTSVSMASTLGTVPQRTTFSDVAPCSLVDIDRRFGGTYCLHHQGNADGGSKHI
jgi:hypothetical protein